MIAPDLPLWCYPALFATGVAAGFVDSIACGGGLITLPVLLAIGIPPAFALGTNKLQASFGSGSAVWHFARAKMVSLRECVPGLAFTAIGAAAGALLVQSLNKEFLRVFIPVALVVIAAYLLLRPGLGEKDLRPRMDSRWFYPVFGLALGFYDGFFGPGTGSFWAMAFVLGLGFNLTKATAYTKAMNFTSNLVSLVCFVAGGQILYGAGCVMGAGQFLGARAGSRMAMVGGARFIRPIFLAMVLALAAKLIYDIYRR